MAGLFCPFSYLQPLQLNMEHEAEEKRQQKNFQNDPSIFSPKKQIDSSPSCGFSRWVLHFELGSIPPPRIVVANEGFGWGCPNL